MKRSKVIKARQQDAMEEKIELLKNIENAEHLKIAPLRYHKKCLVSLDDVSILYGERIACHRVREALI